MDAVTAALPVDPVGTEIEATFARILVPVDFSAGSRRALTIALALRRRFGSVVHLFHLAELGANDQFIAGMGGTQVAPGQLVEDTESRLIRFVENVVPDAGTEVVTHARVGNDVLHGIERVAKHVGATLVLLGAQQKHAIFRTQVEKLVRDLDGTVMLVWVPEETKTAS